MTKRSMGVLATIALALGLLGSFATACSLGTGGTVGVDPEDSIPDNHQELVAPSSEEELSG